MATAQDSAPAAQALFQEGLACQRRGQLTRAEELYTQVVALQPRHAGAHHLLGTIALARGAPERACELINLSIAAQPRLAHSHSDLGRALQMLGRPADALRSYDRALELAPALLDVHLNRALALRQMGRLEEALLAHERCIELVPDHAEVLNNHGVLLLELNRPQAALCSFEKALRATAGASGVRDQGARDLHIGVALNRAITLAQLNRPAEAEACLAESLRVAPENFQALLFRARLLRRLHGADRALECADAALRLQPDSAEALLLRAESLADLARHAEAAACLIALPAGPVARDYARGLQLHLQSTLCDWSGYQEKARNLVAAVDASQPAAVPFHLLSVCDSAHSQLRCARVFTQDKYPVAPPLSRGRYGHDRIRIGYMSGDLREHPVGRLLAGVLERHDRARFQTIAVSLRPADSSALGERVRAAFDQVIDASAMDTHAIAALIRSLEVDILVDLMGHTSGARPEVLALHPAPVQVNWLGFPGTMGAPFIDYILADEFVLPPEQAQNYDEKVVWLPGCFQPNDAQEETAEHAISRAEVGLPDRGFVFCSFNNQYKIAPDVFAVWMRLLRRVPASVLWLFADEQTAQSNLRGAAHGHGVDPARLIFAQRVRYAEHLARLRCADLFLDTFPFNAGASASAALSAGLPLVTRAGESFAARMGGSLLNAVGLPDLVTRNFDEYEGTAFRLATSPALLAEVSTRLRVNRHALFDSETFCRSLERAYHSMWERSERGVPPESFAIEATAR
jgi:predicted O-linked N-acetylglucosamine transferase (SPINDLY family)